MLVALILSDAWPYLRGPAPDTAEWSWPFGLRPVARWWAAGGAALGLWGTAVWWGKQTQRTVWPLILLMGWQFALQVGLVYAANPAVSTELIARAYAPVTAGYFADTIAQTETGGASQFLASYPAQMPHFPSEHMRTHPPGLPLLNWAAVAIMERLPRTAEGLAPAVWHGRCTDLWLVDRPASVAAGLWLVAWLPLLVATTTLPLGYAVGKHLLVDEGQAKVAAVLAGTIPALLLFAPITDQLYAPLGLVAVLFLAKAEGQRSRGAKENIPSAPLLLRSSAYFFAAGLTLSLLTFLSIGNGALAVALGLWMGWRWWDNKASGWQIVGQMAAAVLGGLSLWLVYWLGWGVPPWAIVQEGLNQHYALVTSQRRYEWWLVWNGVDLFLFGGWVWVLAIGRKQAPAESGRLFTAVLVMFLLLNLSGSARGEVGRLWLMGMPLLVVSAVGGLAGRVARPMATLTAVHLALALAIGWGWPLVAPVLVEAQRPSMPLFTPTPPLAMPLADGLLLQGYELQQSETQLQLTLAWQAEGLISRPYTVLNHLINPAGELVAQADGWAGQGQWPPTCWEAGEAVTDAFVVDVTAVPSGRYRLYTGLYDARDGSRPRDPVFLEEVVIGEP